MSFYNHFQSIAVYAVTDKGAELARSIAGAIGVSVFLPEDLLDPAPVVDEIGFASFAGCVAESFSQFDAHVFITAAGIAVRAIAPHIVSKDIDPAVIVMDQGGQHVISLLSGHLGGAEELAQQLAELVDGEAVITTVSESEQLLPIDVLAQSAGCTIHNPDAVTCVNNALLAGEKVILDDPANILDLKHGAHSEHFIAAELVPFAEDDAPSVVVSWRSAGLLEPEEETLLLHPKVLCVGVEAKQGASKEAILELILQVFKKRDIAVESIKCLCSMSGEAEEQAIIDAASELGVEFFAYPAVQLDIAGVPGLSEKSEAASGSRNVAESAALLCSRQKEAGRLLVETEKNNSVVIAVALER